LGKNQGWKRKEPIQEKRWTNAGWPKAAFSVDEGSLGCKKASIGRYQIALEPFLVAEWQMMQGHHVTNDSVHAVRAIFAQEKPTKV
jgi:hypothetical protein